MAVVSALWCLLCIDLESSYHLVNTPKQWQDAEDYCVNTCASHLASMHSQQDFDDVLALAATTSSDVHIGLQDTDGSNTNWTWTDNTLFDYGSTLNTYPWKFDQV